jgi:drug/metabolite transporter (DMT)-like permease
VKGRDAAALAGANLIWGSTYAVARAALDTVPAPALAFLRFALAGLLFAPLVRWRGKEAPGAPGERWGPALLALIGATGFALPKLLIYYGLPLSTATEASILVNLEAVLTALLGAIFLRERLRAPAIAGIAIAFAGALAMAWPAGDPFHQRHALGNLLIIASMVGEAAATVLAVPAGRRYSGLTITAGGSAWGALLLAPAAFAAAAATGGPRAWTSPGCLFSILYLAVAGTVVAYSLLYNALHRVEAGRAAAFLYLQPVVGALLGILWLGEAVTLQAVLGGGLVLVGVVLTTRGQRGVAA